MAPGFRSTPPTATWPELVQDVLLALPLGLLIGLSLGALGAGGSILTVPALVLVLGQSPHEAAGTSLVVVGSIAATGAIEHRRRGSMRLRAGLAFAAAGIIGSLVGSVLSVRTAPDVLALAFSAIMLVAAAMMWRDTRPHDTGDAGVASHASLTTKITRTVIAGSVVGFLTGYFGIGGGFLAVPALTFALGVPITVAVGTSLLVIALNSATALAPRLGGDVIDWTITAAFVAGGVIGAFSGARIAHRVAPARLKRAFAIVVACIAVILAVHAAAGLN